MIEIRKEQEAEYQEIRQVIVAAFGGDIEANLVELLRDRDKAAVTLVAVSNNMIVGHIMFSPVTITSAPTTFRAVGLAPLSVLPEVPTTGHWFHVSARRVKKMCGGWI